MKYELALSGKFKKGLKAAKKRGLDISLLDCAVDKLVLTLVDTGTHADLYKK